MHAPVNVTQRGVVLLCALALAHSGIAQKSKTDSVPDWKPAVLPADALAYGAAMNDYAPPKLKSWCDEFARREMPKRRIDPRETMAVVDKQFPKNSDEARDAAIYLVFYLAYVAEDNNQREISHQLRQNDLQADDIVRQLATIDQNNQKRLGNSQLAQSPQQVMKEQEDVRKLQEQLRELNEIQVRRIKELATSRKRVDGYLKVMDVTYKRMDGIAPAILREFH